MTPEFHLVYAVFAGVSRLLLFKQNGFQRDQLTGLQWEAFQKDALKIAHHASLEAWRETMIKNELRMCVYSYKSKYTNIRVLMIKVDAISELIKR